MPDVLMMKAPLASTGRPLVKRLAIAAVAAAALCGAPSSWAEPPDTQGLIKERDEGAQDLREQELERARRELGDREETERATRRRLESRPREQLDRPHGVPAPPVLRNNPPYGLSDLPSARASDLIEDEAVRRDRRAYDRAVRGREDAERATDGAAGRAAPWKPIGAR